MQNMRNNLLPIQVSKYSNVSCQKGMEMSKSQKFNNPPRKLNKSLKILRTKIERNFKKKLRCKIQKRKIIIHKNYLIPEV